MADQRVAIVTGTNRGIGLEITRQLAGMDGLQVIATARDEAKAKRTEELLKSDGVTVEGRSCDVNDEVSVTQCIEGIANDHGRIDILV